MGIVTFHVHALIVTPPGVATFVTGPFNDFKPGIQPLSGIVETDWLPFTFTMNWKIDAPGRWIEFEKGDPFCTFFPVRLDDIESFDVEVTSLDDNVELKAKLEEYSQSRAEFLEELKNLSSDAVARKWQKDYFQGQDAGEGFKHRTSLKLTQPRRREDD